MIELLANDRALHEILDVFSKTVAIEEVFVTRRTLRNVLISFLNGKIDATELTAWANLVEQHGDEIAYEPGFHKLIATCIFRLSTPEINEPIDEKLCREMMGEIAPLA
jgi:hypothetical protein